MPPTDCLTCRSFWVRAARLPRSRRMATSCLHRPHRNRPGALKDFLSTFLGQVNAGTLIPHFGSACGPPPALSASASRFGAVRDVDWSMMSRRRTQHSTRRTNGQNERSHIDTSPRSVVDRVDDASPSLSTRSPTPAEPQPPPNPHARDTHARRTPTPGGPTSSASRRQGREPRAHRMPRRSEYHLVVHSMRHRDHPTGVVHSPR